MGILPDDLQEIDNKIFDDYMAQFEPGDDSDFDDADYKKYFDEHAPEKLKKFKENYRKRCEKMLSLGWIIN